MRLFFHERKRRMRHREGICWLLLIFNLHYSIAKLKGVMVLIPCMIREEVAHVFTGERERARPRSGRRREWYRPVLCLTQNKRKRED